MHYVRCCICGKKFEAVVTTRYCSVCRALLAHLRYLNPGDSPKERGKVPWREARVRAYAARAAAGKDLFGSPLAPEELL